MTVLHTIETYFFWLVVYSVVGWCYESILESFRQKKLVNRGFMFGPYLPIYGTGALLDVLLLGWISHPVVLFLSAAVLTCVVEFLVSVFLEVVFHRRWWDYNDFKFRVFGKTFDVGRFNIQGRVCLAGFLAFGTLSIVLVYLVHPLLASFTERIPTPVFYIINGCLLVLILLDLSLSVYHLSRKKKSETASLSDKPTDADNKDS